MNLVTIENYFKNIFISGTNFSLQNADSVVSAIGKSTNVNIYYTKPPSIEKNIEIIQTYANIDKEELLKMKEYYSIKLSYEKTKNSLKDRLKNTIQKFPLIKNNLIELVLYSGVPKEYGILNYTNPDQSLDFMNLGIVILIYI
jgi:hypothetical protein